MNEVLQALKKELVEKYFDSDGLAMLDLNDKLNGTVKNDNPLLFAAIFYYLLADLELLDEEDKNRFIKAVNAVQVEPGLYRRKPGDDRLDSHDNTLGIVAGSHLFNLGYGEDVLSYGTRHGYLYNNSNPLHFALAGVRQGGDVATYKILVGKIPAIWEYLWLLGGLVINIFSKNVSTTQLCWLRFKALSKAFNRWAFWPWMSASFLVVHSIWALSFLYKFKSLSEFFSKYYVVEPPRHPLRSLAKYV